MHVRTRHTEEECMIKYCATEHCPPELLIFRMSLQNQMHAFHETSYTLPKAYDHVKAAKSGGKRAEAKHQCVVQGHSYL